MYLYNVTIIVENDICDEVKQHLDAQLSKQRVSNPSLSLLELLDSPHEGTTYCIQLRCQRRSEIEAFQMHHLTTLQTDLNEQYRGKVVFFDSTMKYLND